MKRISVIIPVHNAEKYLEKCLESMVNQLNEQDEILLMNDWSTDSSTQICEKYSKKYNNIFTQYNENGGPSKTRNLGLEKATGKYILFIDADDYLKENYIEKMLEDIEKYELTVCSYSFVYEDKNKIQEQKFSEKLKNTSLAIPKDDFIKLYHTQLLNLVWNKIYRADIIKKNNIRFDENITKGEDLLFNLDYISHMNTDIKIINESLYYYVSKPNGLNRSFKEPIEDRMARTSLVYNKMKKITTKHNNEIIAEIINMYFIHLRNYKAENNLKNPKNAWLEILSKTDLGNILDDINEKGEKPKLNHIRKAYLKKHIFVMFLENKIRLVLGRER